MKQGNHMLERSSIDESEVAKFDVMAEEWWNPNGMFKPLHKMNPTRLDYINKQIEFDFGCDLTKPRPFKNLNILDLGCGGGLLTEPMTRLGANVVGIDVSEKNIRIASTHAQQSKLEIDYKVTSVEEHQQFSGSYDVILCMEVIEHVPDPASFIESCANLLNSNGMIVCSTLNRSAKSFFLAIIGAEYILRWLPTGTHDWNKFIKPQELEIYLEDAGLEMVDCKGFVFNILRDEWMISDRDTDVNYVTTSRKP